MRTKFFAVQFLSFFAFLLSFCSANLDTTWKISQLQITEEPIDAKHPTSNGNMTTLWFIVEDTTYGPGASFNCSLINGKFSIHQPQLHSEER